MDINAPIALEEYECCRCSHRWYPRKQSYPKRCPHCTSAYWDRPTQREWDHYHPKDETASA